MSPRTIAQAMKGRRQQPGPVDPPTSQGGLPRQPLARTVDDRYPGQQVRSWGTPILEPIEAPPLVDSPVEAGEMLALALLGIPTGRADRAFLASAECHWAPSQIAILASLIVRARIAGPAGGAR